MTRSSTAAAPLRIFVLAHALRAAGGLNVGLNLIESMIRQAPQHHYAFVVPANLGYEAICAKAPHGEVYAYQTTSGLHRIWYDRHHLPKLIAAFKPDLLLALGNLGLSNPSCPQAVFVHQPQLVYPTKHFGPQSIKNKLRAFYVKYRFKRQLESTQLLLCQTEVVARRLRDVLGYNGSISVCGTSISPSIFQSPEAPPEPDAFVAHRDSFKLLYLTRYYPHKNIEGIVALFERYGKELEGVVVFLTIAADQHPNAARLLERIAALGLEKQVVNLGPVPHADVKDYYRHSNALMMPTLLETFGIPYLEAMASNLPVITSDLDFAHAVCGDAALYCDPWQIDSMRDAILRLKSNDALRQDLVSAGKQRIEQNVRSWDDIATVVLSDIGAITKAHD